LEGSVRTDQQLQAEVEALRARIAILEQEATSSKQTIMLQERQLNALLETLSDGIFIYDAQGKLQQANSVGLRLLEQGTTSDYGYYAEYVNQFLPRTLHGQPIPQEQLTLPRLLRGETLLNENEKETIIRMPDGEDKVFRVGGVPLRDDRQQIIGGMMILRDVTEQRNSEQRAQESLHALLKMAEMLVESTWSNGNNDVADAVLIRIAKLIRHAFHCTRAGIVTIEPGTQRLRPIAMAGAAPAERQYWLDQLNTTSLQDQITDANALSALWNGQPVVVQTPAQHVEYAGRETLLVPLQTHTQVCGLLSIDYGDGKHDYTQDEISLAQAAAHLIAMVMEREQLLQERAEARARELALREANRRLDDFLGIVSHELKNPLTTINGNIQLAQRRLRLLLTEQGAVEELPEQLELISELLLRAEQQVRVQHRLINDLVDVSRIQAQQLHLSTQSVDLLPLVRETVEDIRMSNPQCTITLEIQTTEATLPLLIDRDRIGQVLTNYLTNALKYAGMHRPITVRVSHCSKWAHVEVIDEGPGIAPEEQERIWERFYRIPGSKTRSSSGLGLGLHICRSIIERHNGQVGVQSQPGEGSTFWFTLPLQRKQE
jgi:PAS domain S-box-containing protein